MCHTTNGACIRPTPDFPNWKYACPAEAPHDSFMWHSFEMDYDTGHGIILCPEHKGIPVQSGFKEDYWK